MSIENPSNVVGQATARALATCRRRRNIKRRSFLPPSALCPPCKVPLFGDTIRHDCFFGVLHQDLSSRACQERSVDHAARRSSGGLPLSAGGNGAVDIDWFHLHLRLSGSPTADDVQPSHARTLGEASQTARSDQGHGGSVRVGGTRRVDCIRRVRIEKVKRGCLSDTRS